tara:strand:+ start:3366 stop:4436 length:1071 start_codon:yes stop_codon:yes gene_type:complete
MVATCAMSQMQHIVKEQIDKGTPVNSASRPSHHTENGFENRYPLPESKKSFFTFLRLRLLGRESWPKAKKQIGKTPVVAPNLDAIHTPDPNVAQVTWIGHSTVLLQYQGINILTDPVFSDRASPFAHIGPKRYSPPGLAIDQLPKINIILLSHNHYDHCDIESLRQIGKEPTYIVPLKNASLLKEAGIDSCIEMDWDQFAEVNGVKIVHTPSYHWSSRKISDRKEMLWGGYALTFPNGFKFYFVGDSGWNEQLFAEMGEKYGPFDLGLIPIGAYDPRDFMKAAHVNPEEAVLIKQTMGIKQAIAIHWGTFVLTAEPVDEPPKRLRIALEQAGLNPDHFLALPVGGTHHHMPTPSQD